VKGDGVKPLNSFKVAFFLVSTFGLISVPGHAQVAEKCADGIMVGMVRKLASLSGTHKQASPRSFRVRRQLLPDFEPMESRITLSRGDSLPGIAAVGEMAKKPPKLLPAADYLGIAEKIWQNRLPAYVAKSAKKPALNQIEQALRVARVPLGTSKVISQQLYEFDNEDTVITYQLNTSHHESFAVQVLTTPAHTVSNVYVGTSIPEVITLTPPTTPLDFARFSKDMLNALGKNNLKFGPVNANAFLQEAYNLLTAEGMPDEAFDADIDLSASFSPDGSELSLVITVTTNLDLATSVAALWYEDGTFELEPESFPAAIPIPDAVPDYTPGLVSVFLNP
jgi:hypothetical protein